MNRLYPNSRRESIKEDKYLNTLPRRGEDGGRSGLTKTKQTYVTRAGMEERKEGGALNSPKNAWDEKMDGDCKAKLAAGTVGFEAGVSLFTDPNSDAHDQIDLMKNITNRMKMSIAKDLMVGEDPLTIDSSSGFELKVEKRHVDEISGATIENGGTSIKLPSSCILLGKTSDCRVKRDDGESSSIGLVKISEIPRCVPFSRWLLLTLVEVDISLIIGPPGGSKSSMDKEAIDLDMEMIMNRFNILKDNEGRRKQHSRSFMARREPRV
ncbi:uncharacterized protein TNCV_5033171 [Trichonephila clavipes]|nr:uncharacterized protein TNCV_5033171 [Trichonephila clavipes]